MDHWMTRLSMAASPSVRVAAGHRRIRHGGESDLIRPLRYDHLTRPDPLEHHDVRTIARPHPEPAALERLAFHLHVSDGDTPVVQDGRRGDRDAADRATDRDRGAHELPNL